MLTIALALAIMSQYPNVWPGDDRAEATIRSHIRTNDDLFSEAVERWVIEDGEHAGPPRKPEDDLPAREVRLLRVLRSPRYASRYAAVRMWTTLPEADRLRVAVRASAARDPDVRTWGEVMLREHYECRVCEPDRLAVLSCDGCAGRGTRKVAATADRPDYWVWCELCWGPRNRMHWCPACRGTADRRAVILGEW